FRLHLEQLIDVAEADGTDGNAVFQEEKTSAGPGSGEYRGADGRQVFLSRTAAEPGAGHLRAQFVDMPGADDPDTFLVDPHRVAGEIECLNRHAGGRDHDFAAGCG